MNLAQVVWYSLAIGFTAFISLFTIAYVSYRIKHNNIKVKTVSLNKPEVKVGHSYNRTMRHIPQKVAYVKKHSEIKETFAHSARTYEELKRREVRKDILPPEFNSKKVGGRFTVLNNTTSFQEENFRYVPSQLRDLNLTDRYRSLTLN